MNRSLLAGLLAGFILGSGLTAMVFLSRKPVAEPAKLRIEPPIAEKKADLPAKDPEKKPESEPTKEEPKTVPPADPEKKRPDLKELLARLSKPDLKGDEFMAIVAAVKAAGKEGLELVIEKLLKGASAQERVMAGALLEQLADPAALPALHQSLTQDKDLVVRRMAAHALAVIGTDGAEAGLRDGMADKDWGVRVNSAYGLAKLGKPDGLDALTQAYASDKTPAEYRLAILGGLADVASPSSAPLFRKILTDTEDESYLLTAIHGLQKMKDTQSIAELQKIAQGAESEMVREAAQKAIEAIQKP